MEQVDFQGGWNSFWGAISGQLGGLGTILTWVGMLMVLGSVIGFIWQKRRGGGGGQGLAGVFIVMFIGALLAAPGALIPGLLGIIDWVGNVIIALVNRASQG